MRFDFPVIFARLHRPRMTYIIWDLIQVVQTLLYENYLIVGDQNFSKKQRRIISLDTTGFVAKIPLNNSIELQ